MRWSGCCERTSSRLMRTSGRGIKAAISTCFTEYVHHPMGAMMSLATIEERGGRNGPRHDRGGPLVLAPRVTFRPYVKRARVHFGAGTKKVRLTPEDEEKLVRLGAPRFKQASGFRRWLRRCQSWAAVLEAREKRHRRWRERGADLPLRKLDEAIRKSCNLRQVSFKSAVVVRQTLGRRLIVDHRQQHAVTAFDDKRDVQNDLGMDLEVRTLRRACFCRATQLPASVLLLCLPQRTACTGDHSCTGDHFQYVQSRKMLHAALLLLILEAASADLVSPSA
jgi:hypothetical protein